MTQEQWSPEPVALKIARLTISASIAESLIRLDGQATPPRRRPQTEPPARYTEDDIARMEALGVGNLDTAGALMLAYEQNRYPGAPRIGFKNHSLGYDLGTDEELRAWAAEAEKVLKTKPRDYDARVKRLEALSGLKARALVRENHRGRLRDGRRSRRHRRRRHEGARHRRRPADARLGRDRDLRDEMRGRPLHTAGARRPARAHARRAVRRLRLVAGKLTPRRKTHVPATR